MSLGSVGTGILNKLSLLNCGNLFHKLSKHFISLPFFSTIHLPCEFLHEHQT